MADKPGTPDEGAEGRRVRIPGADGQLGAKPAAKKISDAPEPPDIVVGRGYYVSPAPKEPKPDRELIDDEGECESLLLSWRSRPGRKSQKWGTDKELWLFYRKRIDEGIIRRGLAGDDVYRRKIEKLDREWEAVCKQRDGAIVQPDEIISWQDAVEQVVRAKYGSVAVASLTPRELDLIDRDSKGNLFPSPGLLFQTGPLADDIKTEVWRAKQRRMTRDIQVGEALGWLASKRFAPPTVDVLALNHRLREDFPRADIPYPVRWKRSEPPAQPDASTDQPAADTIEPRAPTRRQLRHWRDVVEHVRRVIWGEEYIGDLARGEQQLIDRFGVGARCMSNSMLPGRWYLSVAITPPQALAEALAKARAKFEARQFQCESALEWLEHGGFPPRERGEPMTEWRRRTIGPVLDRLQLEFGAPVPSDLELGEPVLSDGALSLSRDIEDAWRSNQRKRRAEWFKRRQREIPLEKRHWLYLTDIAEEYARRPKSLTIDCDEYEAILEELRRSILAGDFEDGRGRSRVLCVHPDRLSELRFNRRSASHPDYFLPIVQHLCITRRDCAEWFERLHLDLPHRLQQSEMSTYPPMIAVGEAINGAVNPYASGITWFDPNSGITWVDPDYDERTGEVLRVWPGNDGAAVQPSASTAPPAPDNTAKPAVQPDTATATSEPLPDAPQIAGRKTRPSLKAYIAHQDEHLLTHGQRASRADDEKWATACNYAGRYIRDVLRPQWVETLLPDEKSKYGAVRVRIKKGRHRSRRKSA